MTLARITDKASLTSIASYPATDNFPIAVPRLLKAIHDQRPDLAAMYDLDDAGGRAAFVIWCLTDARDDYQAVQELARAGLFPGLNDSDPTMVAAPSPVPISGLMRIAWQARGDVQAAFNLPNDAEEFVWWFFLHGARELDFIDLVPDQARASINLAVVQPDTNGLPNLTLLMQRIWDTRPDIKKIFDLSRTEQRDAYIRWFMITGVVEHQLHWLLDHKQRNWLHAPWNGTPNARKAGISNLMGESWAGDPSLKDQFDLSNSGAARRFVSWWSKHGEEPARTRAPLGGEPGEDLWGGVDLFGYTKGELGIGEDVRMLSEALVSAGVPHGAVDVKADGAVPQSDRSLDSRLQDKPRRRAVIFAMTGVETVRVITTRGFSELRDRYVIGNWPWELPHWPDRWSESYDFVDEIWAPSRFIHGAFAHRAPVPVLFMPYPVSIPEEHRQWR
ncbi:hypothetical protein N9F34_01815, partial [Alphaproteobacteria bacterium]|nr:hypothetical protein [Alphaproteobacteria bacterium]